MISGLKLCALKITPKDTGVKAFLGARRMFRFAFVRVLFRVRSLQGLKNRRTSGPAHRPLLTTCLRSRICTMLSTLSNLRRVTRINSSYGEAGKTSNIPTEYFSVIFRGLLRQCSNYVDDRGKCFGSPRSEAPRRARGREQPTARDRSDDDDQ